MGNRAAAGRVYRGGQHFADLSSTRIVGSAFEVWPPISEDLEQALDIDPRHDRLVRGFGPKALTRLRAAKIGVAGSGGGGSHVLQQLAYLGVATLVPADGDRVELTNLNRLIGSAPQRKRRNFVDRLLRRGRGDVGRAKVAVMEELVHAINENAVVDAHFEHFPSAETVQDFKECDLIVACVDRLQVRDTRNSLCNRYLIPRISVGLRN
mgnify:CR=1 FL=1